MNNFPYKQNVGIYENLYLVKTFFLVENFFPMKLLNIVCQTLDLWKCSIHMVLIY